MSGTPPHPVLPAYYPSERERRPFVTALFDGTARHYDLVCGLGSLGSGRFYRRWVLRRAGLQPGMRLLDVATGTGLMIKAALELGLDAAHITGVDPSQGMLAEAAKVFKGPRVRGYGQALPIRSDFFDFVTMGIALRHVSDLRAAFSEYLRVLKPGGRVWILEGHVPRSALGQKMTRFVWAKLIPGMTLVATGSREAKELMDYYWDTVDKAVPPETIVSVLSEVGFEDARAQVVVPGAFVEYTGRKPSP